LRTPQDAAAAHAAGARFAVSPGYNSTLAKTCQNLGMELLPGVATASEIMQACEDGYSFLKFFPAMAAGGPNLLKAWAGVFPDIRFCPTGGITAASAPQLLALPNVLCVGGSWLTPVDAMQHQDWSRITNLAREAARLRPGN
jgi:2-dehydro-3-deoxyphosphogluconate aldolase/(4S)-4-hydroxy-2-oxoglutarate aldolase